MPANRQPSFIPLPTSLILHLTSSRSELCQHCIPPFILPTKVWHSPAGGADEYCESDLTDRIE